MEINLFTPPYCQTLRGIINKDVWLQETTPFSNKNEHNIQTTENENRD
ncbi:hypothetical protein PI172_2304 [Prevotella intermedia]|uniref:Uncharacterized protein n=1 Tax=Prevotella intermedia TaxID=28131 RepID=A0AAD1BIC4_PREIN|nr:hypothetical protein PI172_2304 [Prevotella intermedia]